MDDVTEDPTALTDEDVSTLTDEELAERNKAIQAEQARRAVVTQAEQRTDDMCLEYLRASDRANGGEYVAPTGIIGAYPRGWRVTQAGRAFEAVVPGATTAPPSDEWTEVDPDSPIIDFWEDREYTAGAQVRDAGRIWTATSTVNGPRPSDYPGGWTLTT